MTNRRRARSALVAAPLAVALLDASTSVAAIRPLRLRLFPGLSGIGTRDHVALTFDDGPHPEATPRVLDVLAEMETRATFFVLADELVARPELARRLASEGHEVAVHGRRHRPHPLRTPAAIVADLIHARREVERLTGTVPRFWRPPHGIPTTTGLLCAGRLGLRPVLWTAEAREWRRATTPDTALSLLWQQTAGGGVVLLHDSDCTSVAGAWRTALAVLPDLIAWCRSQGWHVGPLRDHGLDGRATAAPGGR